MTPDIRFIRLPKPGSRCPHTGLSRSGLAELVVPCARNGFTAPVRSSLIKKRHATRGTRLIDFHSLMEYLRGLSPGTSDKQMNLNFEDPNV
jgi:hypothetical protein